MIDTSKPIGKITYNGVEIPIAGGGSQPSPTDGEWVRPSDRPTKPVLNDNEVYWLFGVQENAPNDMAVKISTTNGGTYTVDWGDGNVENVASGSVGEHLFDYNNISATPDSRGYKLVWIKVTPTNSDDTIKAVDTNCRPSWRPQNLSVEVTYIPQVIEFYVRASSMTGFYFGEYNHYAICDIVGLQENNISSSDYMFRYMNALQKIDDLDINNITYISNFMSGCKSYNQPFPSGVTFDNVTTSFMNGCYSYNQPFPSGVTFANVTTYFMYNCYSYNQPFPSGVTFANVTTYFMYNCRSYNQPFPNGVTFANVTTYFMNNCYSYNQPFPNGVTFANVTNSFMNNCRSYNQDLIITRATSNTTDLGTSSFSLIYALKSLRILNNNATTNNLNLAATSLSAEAINNVFRDLPVGTGTITITNTYGVVAENDLIDRTIATNKGYTVSG